MNKVTIADFLKRFSVNIAALALATFIGAVVISQAAYVFHANIGRNPMAPLILGFFAAIIVAAVAPRTAFLPRFLVFTGIFIAELVLSVIFSNTILLVVERYWDGNADAAKPWIYVGGLIPFITCAVGIVVLRRFRLPKPADVDVDWAR